MRQAEDTNERAKMGLDDRVSFVSGYSQESAPRQAKHVRQGFNRKVMEDLVEEFKGEGEEAAIGGR